MKKANILIIGKLDFDLKENFIENVLETENIEEAKDFLKKYNIDLIIFIYDESVKKSLNELLNFIKKLDKKTYMLVLANKYENELLFKCEIDYFLLKPIDKDKLISKIKKVLFMQSNNEYNYTSLFSGIFEPFFIKIFIFNEIGVVNLSLFLETLEVLPITILKIINRIEENLKQGNKIEITLEKSVDYVHLTTNVSLFENDYYIDWVLKSNDTYTYKLPLKNLFTISKYELSNNEEMLEDDNNEFFEEDNDGFLDFDEEDNNFIHNREQISAVEYLKNYHFNKDEIDELEELIEELDLILYAKTSELNEELVEELREAFLKYRAFFVDFLEINDALYSLIEMLDKLDLNKFSHKERKFILEFIKGLHEDLKGWFKHIFIEQNAIDIHYLDASLLSSMIQLKQLLNK